jgi:phosphate transport system protein
MNDVRRVLAREERAIHTEILELARLAVRAVDEAVECLRLQDAERAGRVIANDQVINDLRRRVERECLFAIASQQPVARDLRELIAGLLIASDLERIADHAAGVAKIVREMDPSDISGPMDKLWKMTAVARRMLETVTKAYDTADADLARQVGEIDTELDDLHEQCLATLVMRLATQADVHSHATHLLWIVHNLERIGDHATNVAERVVFLVSGETPELN